MGDWTGALRSRTRTGRVRPARSVRRPRPAAWPTASPVLPERARRRAGRCRHPDHRRIRSARDRPGCPAAVPKPARPSRTGRRGRRGGRSSTRWPSGRRWPARTRVPIRQVVPPSGRRPWPDYQGPRAGGSPTRWCGTHRGRVAAVPNRIRWSRLGWGAPGGRWAGRSPEGRRNRWSRGRRVDQVWTRWPTGRLGSPARSRPGTPAKEGRGTGWRTGPAPEQVACLDHPRAPKAAGRVPWSSRSSAPSGSHAFARGDGPRWCSVAAPGDEAGPAWGIRSSRPYRRGGVVPPPVSTSPVLSRIRRRSPSRPERPGRLNHPICTSVGGLTGSHRTVRVPPLLAIGTPVQVHVLGPASHIAVLKAG